MRALIVDDDPLALDLLQNILQQTGYEIDIAHDGREALALLREHQARLLITDWEMPGMNGVELCQAVRSDDFAGYVYIIMVTARDSAQQKIEGLYAGADNFITKPLNPAELLVCLKTAERILSLETRDLAMFALAKLAESRDPETGLHIERVQSYARLLAQHLSTHEAYRGVIDAEYVRLIYQTCPLHDIGKVGIPDPVLLKPGKLTAEEFAVMKTHTLLGAQTLDAALQRFPGARFLQMARDIAASHHEKFDGSGYPHGLAGQAIPLCGRIVALADVYDALTSRRVYKSPFSHQQSRTIIVGESGHHFDPDVVDAFLQTEEHFIDIRRRLADAEVEAPPASPAPVRPDVEDGAAPKVLVIEDDATQREHLQAILESARYEVLAAADGQQALRLVAEQSPRVVISDWVLPGISGLELCRRIRAMDILAYTHFIMLTVHGEQDRLLQAFDAGVDDFIAKPFKEGELLARLRAGLRIVHLHDELARKNQGSKLLNAQLSGLNSRLEQLAITDDLTGLFNRRHATARLEEQWALADRYNRALTVALVDIDHFKRVNDSHGHAAGDAVLREVGALLRDNARTTDTVCRVGGEEFLMIFPAQSAPEAAVCAERARAAVAAHGFCHEGRTIPLTVSIGIAGRRTGMTQFSELLQDADAAMYAAKQAGRNCVRFAGTQLLDYPAANPAA